MIGISCGKLIQRLILVAYMELPPSLAGANMAGDTPKFCDTQSTPAARNFALGASVAWG
jgi:hypothetical protein